MMLFITQYGGMMLALLLSGALSGFVAGLFGVGGGTITVPVLLTILTAFGYGDDIAMKIAVATSLALIIPTGVSSAIAHHKKGSVRMDIVMQMAVGVALGAACGAYLADGARGRVLMLLFAIFAAAIAFSMLRGQKGFALLRSLTPAWKAHAGAFFIGGFSALLGIGGGVLMVPTLVACGYSMAQAVGASSALGLCVAFPAVISYIITGWGQVGLPAYSWGYLHLIAFLVMAPIATFCAPYGVRLAHYLPEKKLKQAFACYLMIIALRMAYKAASL